MSKIAKHSGVNKQTLIETNRRLNRRCQQYEKKLAKYRRRFVAATSSMRWIQRRQEDETWLLRRYRHQAHIDQFKARNWNLLWFGVITGFIVAIVIIGVLY